MKVAVKDACVLIDLANGGLLDAWFQLRIETCTTNLVLRQIRSDSHWQAVKPYVDSGDIREHYLSGDEMTRVQQQYGQIRVGIEDATAIFLAVKLDAVLLTGDRQLRLEGLKRNLEVRGIIWILDELVNREIISKRIAASKLTAILEGGAFLPKSECAARFKKWE